MQASVPPKIPPRWLTELPQGDPWSTPFAECLLRKLEVPVGGSVLDVACGSGIPTFHLAHLVGQLGKVVGIDLHEGQLARARAVQGKHFPWLKFIRADVRSLPSGLGTFDRIVGNLAFMFFRPNRPEVLRHLYSFLRPTGQIVLTFPSQGTFDSLWWRVDKEMQARGFSQERAAFQEYLRERPSARDARNWLEACGFDRVEVEECPLEVETAPGAAFLHHPLLRGGFLDDVYECFPDQAQADDMMQDIADDLHTILPLIAQRCVMSGWRPGAEPAPSNSMKHDVP